MKRTVALILLVFVLLGGGYIATGLAQNAMIRWSAVDAGFGTQMLTGTKIMSVVGLSFTGAAQTSGGKIQSGFLAGRLAAGNVTGVRGTRGLSVPSTIVLNQNYPNPFNPSTTIRYGLPGRSHVVLTVFNILGQRVVELVNGDIDAGYHEVLFNAGNLASGVYFYRLQTVALHGASGGGGTATFVETKRLNLVK